MIQKTDLFWSVIVLVVPTAMSVLNVDARSASRVRNDNRIYR